MKTRKSKGTKKQVVPRSIRDASRILARASWTLYQAIDSLEDALDDVRLVDTKWESLASQKIGDLQSALEIVDDVHSVLMSRIR